MSWLNGVLGGMADVYAAFGIENVRQLAAKAGLNAQDAVQQLAALLPQAIDRLTPTGTLHRS